jgi:hypothetical protein
MPIVPARLLPNLKDPAHPRIRSMVGRADLLVSVTVVASGLHGRLLVHMLQYTHLCSQHYVASRVIRSMRSEVTTSLARLHQKNKRQLNPAS